MVTECMWHLTWANSGSNKLLPEQMLGIINRMAWQWAETPVEIRETLVDIRGTTK